MVRDRIVCFIERSFGQAGPWVMERMLGGSLTQLLAR